MPGKCLIISGGEFSSHTDIPVDFTADYIIACDKGFEHAQKLGLRPDLVLGDFDSYKGKLDSTISTIKLPCEKDDTDTMYAVKTALNKGYDDITIICAMGARFDHMMGNIQACTFAAKEGAFACISGANDVLFFINASSLYLPYKEGWSISVFSITDTCTDVSITGAKYNLECAQLSNTVPIGVSNEWDSDSITVSCGAGILMVVQSRL